MQGRRSRRSPAHHPRTPPAAAACVGPDWAARARSVCSPEFGTPASALTNTFSRSVPRHCKVRRREKCGGAAHRSGSMVSGPCRRGLALLLLALVACEFVTEAHAQITHSAVNHPRPPVTAWRARPAWTARVPGLPGLSGTAACPPACGSRSPPTRAAWRGVQPGAVHSGSRALQAPRARRPARRRVQRPAACAACCPRRAVRGVRSAARVACSDDDDMPFVVARPSCAAPPLCCPLPEKHDGKPKTRCSTTSPASRLRRRSRVSTLAISSSC